MTPQEEFELGLAFYKGKGREESIREAIKHIEIAANAGNLAAMNTLGIIYLEDGPYKSVESAIKWFTLASNNGHSESILNLGKVFYFDSYLGACDYTKAFDCRSIECQTAQSENE